MTKPNLLILGASGGVATSFLHYLVRYRDLFDKLALLSSKDKISSNIYLDHKNLNYIFIKKRLNPNDEKDYHNLLKKYKINIVLDLTDAESIPLLESTNKFGASYINTSLNAEGRSVAELVFEIYPKKNKLNKAPHILCAGMNPGIVNMLVKYGMSKFGTPKEIIHFEYDTSRALMPIKLRHVAITWSPHEFLVESVRDPSGVAIGKNQIKKLLPNALNNRENMKPILNPILKLYSYPKGFVVLHEENLTLSLKYNIPSRFVYAIDETAMNSLIKMYNKKNRISLYDLNLITNTNIPLEGSDNIGVLLEYNNKKVYYFNSIYNQSLIGTNATYYQVILGVYAALFTLLFDKLEKKVYFTEDLFHTNYKNYVFDNMRIQEFVFKKKDKKLSLLGYSPVLISKNLHNFRHLYI